jgi:sterol desaturase/sphingolipid hydroxylase (fatty acid hydroxylase superfamily)
LVWGLITSVALHITSYALYFAFRKANPAKTSTKYFFKQLPPIEINFILCPLVQVIFEVLIEFGYSKVNTYALSPYEVARDTLLWIVAFEWAWYFQHRIMHDWKFMWHLGHYYHHGWNEPEMMIGITNFAFDHIVEFWVTMSSSFVGYLVFPSHFYTTKAISLLYMVASVVVHWEGWELTRYHINHHYMVTKNFGGFVPFYDMILGTYQWEPFVHSKSIKS